MTDLKNLGMLQTMKLCRQYSKMNSQERNSLQEERLIALVEDARKRSPFYRKLYRNVPEQFCLSDLPPVSKKELMAQWDEWLTDRDVKLSEVNTFMENLDNIGRKFKGKYLVFTTSGSTGNPLVALADKSVNNVMGGINTMRAYARKEDLKAFMKKGARSIGVFATGGFYLGNSTVRSRLLAMPWKKRQFATTSALLPIDKIVAQLNDFQPVMLGGYPSNLELLIDEANAGRLRISPVIIMTGGEYLSDTLRQKLSETFHCYVQTSYSSTEGGSMACECRKQHFHINDDWILIEPVDKDNCPVADGVLSDKILITNLYNYTQPFIRYEVTDRVIMHHEPCGCGNCSPWIELEGRTDDVVTMERDGQTIKLAPLAIYAVLKEVHSIRRFQLLVYKENKMELRLEQFDGDSREEAFEQAKAALQAHLEEHGITDAEITLSEEVPRQDRGSGKYKHIINVK